MGLISGVSLNETLFLDVFDGWPCLRDSILFELFFESGNWNFLLTLSIDFTGCFEFCASMLKDPTKADFGLGGTICEGFSPVSS